MVVDDKLRCNMSVGKVNKGDINDFNCATAVGGRSTAHNCSSGGIFTWNHLEVSLRMVPRGRNKHPAGGSSVYPGASQQNKDQENCC